MSTAVASRGLEGIVATTSSICWIDGDAGVLSYRGIDIHELAQRSTFEETTYLLWFGKLPTPAQPPSAPPPPPPQTPHSTPAPLPPASSPLLSPTSTPPSPAPSALSK